MKKIFPYCPGVTWSLSSEGYVIPKLERGAWEYATKNRDIVIVCFGGLFETLMSLTFAEAVKFYYPEKSIFWTGDVDYKPLVDKNDICQFFESKVDKKVVKKYPIPIFLDEKNYAYYNCLFNYINRHTIDKKKRHHDVRAVSKQIFNNSLFEWKGEFTPKIRKKDEIKNEKIENTLGFGLSGKYCLIVPEREGYSERGFKNLKWSPHQVRSLASMLSSIGVKTVVLSSNDIYKSSSTFVLEPSLDNLLICLQNSNYLLSEEVDIALGGLLLSESFILGPKTYSEFGLIKNKKFLKSENKIETPYVFEPYEVFNLIK